MMSRLGRVPNIRNKGCIRYTHNRAMTDLFLVLVPPDKSVTGIGAVTPPLVHCNDDMSISADPVYQDGNYLWIGEYSVRTLVSVKYGDSVTGNFPL